MKLINAIRYLNRIDRRVLYTLLILAITIPFFFTIQIPVPISRQTDQLYNAIEALPEHSLVLFGADWSASTRGENRAQSIALMLHLMRKKVRIIILCFDPQAKTLMQNIVLKMQKEHGYQEGRDWANFGYRTDQANFLKAFAQNIPSTLSMDIHGTRVQDLPVMHGVQTARDIAMLVNISASATTDTYIQYLQGSYHLKMAAAVTSVMVPEAFNRLDSGQLVGLMPGLQGAIEYEQKLGYVGKASAASVSASVAHLLVIALILLGNICMLLEKRIGSAERGKND